MKNKKMLLMGLLGLLVISGCKPKPSSSEPNPSGSDPVTSEDVCVPTSDPTPEVPDGPLAVGVKNFSGASFAEKEEVLAGLEGYALEHFTGGIPYRDNSGYLLFNERVTLPTNDYVTGYGFGVDEASLSGPLSGDVARPTYYHTWSNQQPGTLNALNSTGSMDLDANGMFTAGYFSTKFNADKSGYEWYPLLAETERPVPLNLNVETNLATKWQVKVKVGGDLKYNFLGKADLKSTFDGRPVALEDYLTPFKLLIEEKWRRASDLGAEGTGFVGVAEELAKETGRSIDNVAGIKLNEAEQAIEFEFIKPKTAFYAMYNLASNLYSPIPMDYIEAIGGAKNYGLLNPDNVISLGLYTLESIIVTKEMVWKKNPYYIEADRYTIPGQVVTILENSTIAFQEFLAGKLDSARVPTTKLQEFKNDPRARRTEGTGNFKLQVNGLEQAQWDEWFGPNGTKTQGSDWTLKPIMANKDFLRGVYFAIDRESIADRTGSRAQQTILADAYSINPEAGLSWRKSEAGKAVAADYLPETHGFSEELAGQYFSDALDTLVAQCKYKPGTEANPTKITLSMEFFDNQQKRDEGDPLATQIKQVFNRVAKPKGFELDFDVKVAIGEDYEKTYDAMQNGEFDFAFGTIGGNPLNPIDFMDTMSSSVSWNLSWIHDTSVVQGKGIMYKGEVYSYDALQAAGMGLTLLKDGAVTPQVTIEKLSISASETDASIANVVMGGTYFDDPTGEFVVKAPEDGLAYIVFTDPGVTEYQDFVPVEGELVLENGEWHIEGTIEVPPSVGMIGFYVEWEVEYKGEVSGGYLIGLVGEPSDFGLVVPA